MGSRQKARFVTTQSWNSNRQSEIHNSSAEIAEHHLNNERKSNRELNEALNEAERQLRSGNVGRGYGGMSATCKAAIVAYSLERPPLYRDFNSATRGMTYYNYQHYKYYGLYLTLNQAILDHGSLYYTRTVYRGVNFLVSASINQSFYFNQITSTSANQSVAQSFKSGSDATLLILEINKGLDISSLSVFPSESEYILPAFSKFIVTKIINGRNIRKIYLRQEN